MSAGRGAIADLNVLNTRACYQAKVKDGITAQEVNEGVLTKATLIGVATVTTIELVLRGLGVALANGGGDITRANDVVITIAAYNIFNVEELIADSRTERRLSVVEIKRASRLSIIEQQ